MLLSSKFLTIIIIAALVMKDPPFVSSDPFQKSQARKLRKYKERRLEGYHGGPNMGENLADVLNSIEVDDDAPGTDEEESYIDPEQAVVTKVKRWDNDVVKGSCLIYLYDVALSAFWKSFMFCTGLHAFYLYSFDLSKPISIKEAIFALDYIDHDFYVFRDEETNEVSVVYKRNAGGVGLIQPEQ